MSEELLNRIREVQSKEQEVDHQVLQEAEETLIESLGKDYVEHMSKLVVPMNIFAAIDRLELKSVKATKENIIEEIYHDKKDISSKQDCKEIVESYWDLASSQLIETNGVFKLIPQAQEYARKYNKMLYEG